LGTRGQRLSLAVAAIMILAACSGTWVDDGKNFDRVFGFDKPQGVTVIHSFYWKSSHWSTEYRYFIALQPSTKFVEGLTDKSLAIPVAPDEKLLDSCGEKPQWFLPKPLARYEAWKPKTNDGYRIFRDKSDGTLFVCDQQL
jgi:hypothetical protein